MKTFELIEAYDKYIQLLSDECSDLSSMAMVHGWQSTRHKDGNRLREEISLLKMKILTQSAPITHEPASSGQSAEDVLKGMYGNNTQYGYSFNSTIEAMRLHAAQVCADKDREIDARVEHWDKYYKSCLSMCSRLTDENKHLKSELDRLNESLTVIVRKNAELEKEVKEAYDKGVSVGRRDI